MVDKIWWKCKRDKILWQVLFTFGRSRWALHRTMLSDILCYLSVESRTICCLYSVINVHGSNCKHKRERARESSSSSLELKQVSMRFVLSEGAQIEIEMVNGIGNPSELVSIEQTLCVFALLEHSTRVWPLQTLRLAFSIDAVMLWSHRTRKPN